MMVNKRDDQPVPIQPGHLSQYQRALVGLGLALSRKDVEETRNRDEFREGILEAVELLRDDHMQEAALKIDDALMLLPPEKRVGRLGAAEWARRWWCSHLYPLVELGGVMPGNVPGWWTGRNDRGSDIYQARFAMDQNEPEVLLQEILKGNVLHPHLPDRENPAWNMGSPHLEPPGYASRSLIGALVTLTQISEYLDVGENLSHNPWMNGIKGMVHATLANDSNAHKGLESLLEDYTTWWQENDPGSDDWDAEDRHQYIKRLLDSVKWLFSTQSGGGKGGKINEELWDLLTVPRERSEWARINDDIAVRHIAEAIKFLPWTSVYPLAFTMIVCLVRLGRFDDAASYISPIQYDTLLPSLIPAENMYPVITLDDQEYIWAPEDTFLENISDKIVSRKILSKKVLVLGRSRDSDIVVPGKYRSASREHARMWIEDGVVWLEDLASRNGTYLNKCRLDSRPVPVPVRPELSEFTEKTDRHLWHYWTNDTQSITLGKVNLSVGWIRGARNKEHQGRINRGYPVHHPRRYPNDLMIFFRHLTREVSYWAGEIGHIRRPFSTPHEKSGFRSFLSTSLTDAPIVLESLDTAINYYEEGDLIPFELYHLRSGLHGILGNPEDCKRDQRSAEESLTAEFSAI